MIMIITKVLIIAIFKIILTTMIIIVMDRYSKLIRSSYKYCFPHFSFCEINAF